MVLKNYVIQSGKANFTLNSLLSWCLSLDDVELDCSKVNRLLGLENEGSFSHIFIRHVEITFDIQTAEFRKMLDVRLVGVICNYSDELNADDLGSVEDSALQDEPSDGIVSAITLFLMDNLSLSVFSASINSCEHSIEVGRLVLEKLDFSNGQAHANVEIFAFSVDFHNFGNLNTSYCQIEFHKDNGVYLNILINSGMMRLCSIDLFEKMSVGEKTQISSERLVVSAKLNFCSVAYANELQILASDVSLLSNAIGVVQVDIATLSCLTNRFSNVVLQTRGINLAIDHDDGIRAYAIFSRLEVSSEGLCQLLSAFKSTKDTTSFQLLNTLNIKLMLSILAVSYD